MNNERVRNWAHIAEIVSGVAVVVTLVFLVVEVRGNSDLIRANTFNRSIESLIDYRMQIASSDQALETMNAHWQRESPESLRRQLLVVNLWSIYEKTYFSQQYGLVGPAEWQRFESRICRYVQTEEGLRYWSDNVVFFLTNEFRDYVRSSCNVAEPVVETSPYAGEESRNIKSLSEREIRALKNGAGMGFAKLAELNSYPGPRHVLAVAKQLQLSASQEAQTEALYDAMHRQAVTLGEKVIAAEAALDRKFSEASIDEPSLNAAMLEIARLRAELRYVHLEAHLRQRQLLSDEQVDRYDELRGYTSEGS